MEVASSDYIAIQFYIPTTKKADFLSFPLFMLLVGKLQVC